MLVEVILRIASYSYFNNIGRLVELDRSILFAGNWLLVGFLIAIFPLEVSLLSIVKASDLGLVSSLAFALYSVYIYRTSVGSIQRTRVLSLLFIVGFNEYRLYSILFILLLSSINSVINTDSYSNIFVKYIRSALLI
jgi:uncharacterized membrane-anchored protein